MTNKEYKDLLERLIQIERENKIHRMMILATALNSIAIILLGISVAIKSFL